MPRKYIVKSEPLKLVAYGDMQAYSFSEDLSLRWQETISIAFLQMGCSPTLPSVLLHTLMDLRTDLENSSTLSTLVEQARNPKEETEADVFPYAHRQRRNFLESREKISSYLHSEVTSPLTCGKLYCCLRL
jgi:hypothetical protein